MKAEDKKLLDVFNGHRVFEIPYFQRSYVWDYELWRRFLDDMEELSKPNSAPHFIGSIILKQRLTAGDDIGDVRVVIDGQQRFTTFAIFYKVLSLKKGMPNIFWSRFGCVIHEGEDDESIVLAVKHNHIDKKYFEEIVNLEKAVDYYEGKRDDEILNMNKIVKLYQFFLKNIDVDKINISSLNNKLLFVRVDLGCDEDEQQIFDTINSLGIRLTTSELLKNYLFNELNEKDYNTYWKNLFETDEDTKQYWDQIVTTGTSKHHLIDLFLYVFLIIKVRNGEYDVSTEDKLVYSKWQKLFHSYKHFVENYMNGDKNVLMQELNKYAKTFKKYFDPNCVSDSIPSNPGIERINFMVFNLDFTTMIPYVMYVLMNANNDEQLKIFSYLESFLIRRTIAKLETRGYFGLFYDGLISNNIITKDSLKEYVEKNMDVSYRPATDDEVRRGINYYVFVNKQVTGFLYMLESRLRKSNLSCTDLKGFKAYTLEHLMPKKWMEKWNVPENDVERLEINKAVYTMGNLAIITSPLNASISNSVWSVKLHGNGKKTGLLANTKGIITLDEYLQLPEWNLDTIRKRANDLCTKILSVWQE